MPKIPEKAPTWRSLVKWDFNQNDPVIASLIQKTDKHYYYWDKVRVQPLPKEANRELLWSYIRWRRHSKSSLTPILDVKNVPFTYWLTDEMQRNLHLIDQGAGGNLTLWDPEADKQAAVKVRIASQMEEAITSSQIEGAVATIKDAKKMILEKRKPKNNSEQMIYNNYVTMKSLKEVCKEDLSLSLLLELHATITNNTLESKEEEGKFRTEQDAIHVVTNYGEVLFTPPKANEITPRVKALIQFANDKESTQFIHPVIKAIMLHFWIAYIHPFTDGNGRMARTLFYWYMLKHEYWFFEYTAISKTILKKTTQYANAYLYSEHDDNDLTYFIHFHLNVIVDTMKELGEHITKETRRNYQLQHEVVAFEDLNIRQARIMQHVTDNPQAILTIKVHQNINQVAYQTARTDLLELEKKGWLKSVKKGKTFYFVRS